MSHITFHLNCGQYVIHADGEPISRCLDEIAIVLDKESFTRHKVGDPEKVKAWYDKAVKAYRDHGFGEMADDLVLIQGRFTLEDLDRVMSCSGYAAMLYKQLNEGSLKFLDLQGTVIEPALVA